MDELREKLETLPNYQHFIAETSRQAHHRLLNVIHGMEQSLNDTPDLCQTDAPTLWQEGTSQLYDYPGNGPIVLFVPSLINRSYILDLAPNASLIGFLQQQNIHPMLLDWGEPSEAERNYTIEHYVDRLGRAIEEIEGPVTLIGYCMGGIMALAAALNAADKINGLGLLATPWDFHSNDTIRIPFTPEQMEEMRTMFTNWGTVPKELVYMAFYFQDPWSVHEKYEHFSTGWESNTFQAREYWVHDGIPITAGVANDCFIDWAYYNILAKGIFVDPTQLHCSAFVAIPEYDRIVPPLNAKALADLLPNATTITCPSGHVGMIAGSKSQQTLWEPLAKWVNGL